VGWRGTKWKVYYTGDVKRFWGNEKNCGALSAKGFGRQGKNIVLLLQQMIKNHIS
jgi:hypothetical protein